MGSVADELSVANDTAAGAAECTALEQDRT
jgi:hypothetical protein